MRHDHHHNTDKSHCANLGGTSRGDSRGVLYVGTDTLSNMGVGADNFARCRSRAATRRPWLSLDRGGLRVWPTQVWGGVLGYEALWETQDRWSTQ